MLKKNPDVLMIWVYFLNEEPGEDPLTDSHLSQDLMEMLRGRF